VEEQQLALPGRWPVTADVSGQGKEQAGFLVAPAEQYRCYSAPDTLVPELLDAYGYFILTDLEKSDARSYPPPVEQIKTKFSNYQDKHIKFSLSKS